MADNESKMSGTTFRMRFGCSVGITYTIALVIIGLIILSLFLDWGNKRDFSRFQHDFFAVLSGNSEGMRYGRADSERIALALRAIPADRLDEDFSDMLALALSGSYTAVVRDQIAVEDFSKSERLALYTDFMDVGDWRKTFLDMKMRLATKRVLQGGVAPQIEGAERKLILPFDYWVPWILLVQLIAFAIYAVVCRFAGALTGGHGDVSDYNPLLDVPKGSGSKLALLLTIPGSLPVMLVILLLSAPSRIKARIGQGSAKAKRVASIEAGAFSSQSSRESLARLKKRAEGR